MHNRLRKFAISCTAILAACSVRAPDPMTQPEPKAAPPAVAIFTPAPPTAAAPPVALLTLEAYKRAFAERVAHASPDLFREPVPPMLKSVVVLDITIDREGRVAHVEVRRSNGYKALENRAMDSVRRAAPYASPSRQVRRGDGTVNFLETFLFRDDGRFQIRTLVADAQ